MAAVLRRLSSKSNNGDHARGKIGHEELSLAGGHSGSSFEDSTSDHVTQKPGHRSPPRVPSTQRRSSFGASITRSLSRKLSLGSNKARDEDGFDETKQYYYQPQDTVDSHNVVASRQLDAQLKSMLIDSTNQLGAGTQAQRDATTIEEDEQETPESETAPASMAAAGYLDLEEELGEHLKNFERLLNDPKKGSRERKDNMEALMNDSQTSLRTKLSVLDSVVLAEFKEFL